ncbi:MAG: hypothetical protein V1778_02530 [bacterium]
MMSDDQGVRQLYRVEKYEPTRCPACHKPLTVNGQRGFLYDLAAIQSFESEPDEDGDFLRMGLLLLSSNGRGMPVVCSRCQARFCIVRKEIRHYADPRDVALALENEGFLNPQVVEARGNVPDVWPPKGDEHE